MVLCEITESMSLLQTWLFFAVLGFVLANGLSAVTFYSLYWNPTYDMWKKKSNPEYPALSKVREEIFQMNKGMLMAVFPPALTIWMTHRKMTNGYCGLYNGSIAYELFIQCCYFIFLDFVEFLYHYSTHRIQALWKMHRYHHQFFNPTPFAVIADELLDQLVRAAPMAVFPFIIPINVDVMFALMGLVIYGYGTYLHCGYELDYPDAHHRYLNTSFQHYCHHAVSIYRKPYHCGFVLNLFDHLFGSVYTGKCFCCKCAQDKGERSLEKWKALKKPDYSSMLTFEFWKKGFQLQWEALKHGEFINFW